MPHFILKLNWRLILIHLIACRCFINAFNLFCNLHDLAFTMGLFSHSNDLTNYFKIQHNAMFKLFYDGYWIIVSKLIGLVVAVIISLVIVIRKKWYWVNSLLIFLIAFILMRFDLLDWRYINFIFRIPGKLFGVYTIGYFITNGIVMLGIGLLLFFLPPVIKFIDCDRQRLKKSDVESDSFI